MFRKHLPSPVVSSNASFVPGAEDGIPSALVDLVDHLADPGLAQASRFSHFDLAMVGRRRREKVSIYVDLGYLGDFK